MRLVSRRRKLILVAAALLLCLVVGVALAFGPVVRARVASEAAKRHVEVQVGSVRPGWFSVHLTNLTVRPSGVTALEVHLEEVDVGLSAGLRVSSVVLHGGEVRASGSFDTLRDQIRAWREQGGPPSGAAARSFPISGDSFVVVWVDRDDRVAQAHGLGFRRDEEGMRFSVGDASLHLPDAEAATIELADASVELDPHGDLVRAHADTATLAWTPPAAVAPSEVSEADSPAKSATPTPRGAKAPPPPAPLPSTPLVPLPDTHALRERATTLAKVLELRMPEGAEASVDAMTWKIGRDGDRPSFTIGPGPAVLTRTPTQFEARYSTDTHASSTALSARVLLPAPPDGGDVSASLEGGPVSLGLLGIKEGAAGLVEVDRATVTGRARITLAGDGSALSVDAELGTRDLSIHQPRLAADVVRGIDLELRVRGVLSDAGELRLDDFAATWGSIHLAGSGVLDQKPDHVAATFRFELPSAPCQSLLESVPTALLPALQGTKMSGTLGARGRFAFDTRSLDELELDYDVQDQCRVVQVPATLARQRFKQAFAHRIYLPDGSTGEQLTGPGTANWTPLGSISPYMQVAVLTTEDGGFPHHRGFNRPAIRSSIIANLAARRFVRGASTITMQLAKNLFLARDKTLARKLQEVVLTDYLEQTFSKDELMELYLNVIEFGPAVYGVTAATEYYFGRSPADLNLAESLFLSSVLPAPLRYGAMRDAAQVPDGWLRSLRSLMRIANKRGLVTDDELAESAAEPIVFWRGGQRPPPRPLAHLRSRLEGDDADAPLPLDGSPDMP